MLFLLFFSTRVHTLSDFDPYTTVLFSFFFQTSCLLYDVGRVARKYLSTRVCGCLHFVCTILLNVLCLRRKALRECSSVLLLNWLEFFVSRDLSEGLLAEFRRCKQTQRVESSVGSKYETHARRVTRAKPEPCQLLQSKFAFHAIYYFLLTVINEHKGLLLICRGHVHVTITILPLKYSTSCVRQYALGPLQDWCTPVCISSAVLVAKIKINGYTFFSVFRIAAAWLEWILHLHVFT